MKTNHLVAGIAALVLLGIAMMAAIVMILNGAKDPAAITSKDDAIEQARSYKPSGVCTQALVPATHEASGARYTFTSGCLAPGWKAGQ